MALWGKSSWFGGPNDKTTGPTTASGAPVTEPGIAVYDHSTLGGWWAIKSPTGGIGVVKQTDIGPAPSTGRKFDYTYSLLPYFGYSQANFPTGGQTYGIYLGKSPSDSTFGANLQNALGQLGATPKQLAAATQSVDAGALSRGYPFVFKGSNPTYTTPDPAGGATASEAVPAGPQISNPLAALWQSIVGDAKYAGVMIGVLLLGALMIFHAFAGGGGGGKPRMVIV